MTAEKIEALNDLGFTWAKRKGQAAWNEKFQELVLYKDEHGDCKSRRSRKMFCGMPQTGADR